MSPEQERASVLIIAGETPGERLRRWIETAGELSVRIDPQHSPVFDPQDESRFDLVVTELDTASPSSRLLLERMLDGELLFGIPQLHLLDDPALHERFQSGQLDIAAMAIRSPGDAADVQARVQLAAEIGRLRRELFRSAIQDQLTGTYTRVYLTQRLEQEVARSRRHGEPLSLVLLEVDGVGSDADSPPEPWDARLARLAELVKPRVRREDVLARWDQRSLALFLSSAAHGGASTFVDQLRQSIASRAPGEAPLRFSAGIASIVGGAASADDMVRAATDALRHANEAGGDRVFIDPGVLERPRKLIVLADDDLAFCEAAAQQLALDGYEVVQAENHRALLDVLKARRPDLLVLGLQLAPSTDRSTALLESIQDLSLDSPLPVVALAPSSERRSALSSMRVRVDRYLTKPFSATVLRAVARDLAGHSPTRRTQTSEPGV